MPSFKAQQLSKDLDDEDDVEAGRNRTQVGCQPLAGQLRLLYHSLCQTADTINIASVDLSSARW